MAETLVLAELSVDASGVVSGVDVADDALARGGRGVDQFARRASTANQPLGALTSRLFSLRSAAVALFGSFTVGGAIFALRSLVEEAARGAPAFKELAASSEVFHRNILRMIRDVPGFNSILHAMSESILVTAAAAKAIGPLGLLGLIAGAPAVGLGPGFIDRFTEALEKLRAEQRALMNQTKNEWIPLIDQTLRLSESAVMSTQTWTHAMQEFGDQIQRTMTAWRDVIGEGARIIEEDIKEVNNVITTAEIALEAVSVAGQQAGQALAQAFLEGGLTMREALEQILKQTAAAMFVKSLEYFALGLAALTPWGRALLGRPELYFKAAAAFLGVGAAIGGLGLGVGGRGGQGAAGRGAGGGFAPTQRQEPTRSIVISIDGGTFMGTNEAAVARWLMDAIRRAERSNA